MSKGSNRRPSTVSYQKRAENYERIFGKKRSQKKEPKQK